MNSKFFQDTLKEHKDGPLAVGWKSKESQEIRFKVFNEIGELKGKSILDVGCGLGDFYNYLKDVNYTGVDIVPEMLVAAKKKYPLARFLDKIPNEEFDYVFESGIFNLPDPNWDEIMVDTLMEMWEHCKIAMGVNFLSSYTVKKAEGTKYTDPTEIIKFTMLLSPKFILRHDYKSNDFTIFLYR